jgi:hypothetical protein
MVPLRKFKAKPLPALWGSHCKQTGITIGTSVSKGCSIHAKDYKAAPVKGREGRLVKELDKQRLI